MGNPKVLTTAKQIARRYKTTLAQAKFLIDHGFFKDNQGQINIYSFETAYDFVSQIMLIDEISGNWYHGRIGASPHLLGPGGHSPKKDEIKRSYVEALNPIGFMESDTPLGLNGSFYPHDVTLMLLEKFLSSRAT